VTVTASQVPLAVGSGDVAAEVDAARLADHLKTCIAGYMDRAGVSPSDWRGQPLSREEVAYFRRAAEEGLLVVTDDAA
jgi:hypothetical protein